ncbi:MAG TPA: hypothetical protein VM487_11630 [Phycisphaerae bacterium]|nr:hypothetical protein [Phycisphaerae bacterium]
MQEQLATWLEEMGLEVRGGSITFVLGPVGSAEPSPPEVDAKAEPWSEGDLWSDDEGWRDERQEPKMRRRKGESEL